MRPFLNFIYFILVASSLNAQYWSNMAIIDPATGKYHGRATIESAIAEITPLDSYLDVQLELTFSGRNLGLNDTTQYEIEFYFDLPDRSIMHDLWLWIGDSVISKSIVLDRWTAAFTYNDIVGRRQDPAILFKRYNSIVEDFELRIYPMLGSESRKVKLHFLLPCDWSQKDVKCLFPFSIFKRTHIPVEDFALRFNETDSWQNPFIPQFPEIKFQQVSDSSKTYLEAYLSQEHMVNFHLQLDASFKEGIFVSKYETDNENYYQVIMYPSLVLRSNPHKKIAVLLEHDSLKTSFSRKTVFQNARNELLSNLSNADSFNVFYSGEEIARQSEKWLSVDSINITKAFNDDSTHLLKHSYNLPGLFKGAVDFIKKTGDDASILLISSSEGYGNYEDANSLIGEILDSMDTVLPVTIADYQNRNIGHYDNGNFHANGNEYFYENLTRKTDGEYFNIRYDYHYDEITRLFKDAIVSINGFITFFDLYPDLAEGFTYARIESGVTNGKVYINRPVYQIGRYIGSFPMDLKITGFYNHVPFEESITIDNPVSSNDTLVSKIWAGNYIHDLESEYYWNYYDNSNVEQILSYSLEYHVLSLYSSFLSLEPGDSVRYCENCGEGWDDITAIEEEKEVKIYSDNLSVAPNPFNNSTRINLSFKEPFNADNSNLVIFNILGQKVKTIDLSSFAGSQEIKITWDGLDDNYNEIASGTYFLIFRYGEKLMSHKLLFLK